MSATQETLTLEEANKVRVSLGLAPIGAEVDGGDDADAPVDQDAVAEANFAERRAKERKEKEERELQEKIAKWVGRIFHSLPIGARVVELLSRLFSFEYRKNRTADRRSRNRTALNAKLKGSTLGDASIRDDALSTKDWLRKQKKRAAQREKEMALKRQREMEEADKAVYDESGFRFSGSGLSLIARRPIWTEGHTCCGLVSGRRGSYPHPQGQSGVGRRR